MTVLSTAPGRARVRGEASRAKGSAVAGIAAAAVGVMLLQLRDVDLGAIVGNLRIGWLIAAVAAAAASILAAVHNLSAFAPIRLRLRDSIRAQLAICGIRVVTPSAVSTPAVCARFLNRSGLAPAESLAVVGAAQVAQLVMTVVVVGAVALVGSDGLSAPTRVCCRSSPVPWRCLLRLPCWPPAASSECGARSPPRAALSRR